VRSWFTWHAVQMSFFFLSWPLGSHPLVTVVAGSIFGPLFLSSRWGWVFLERARILSGIQFTTHFIEFFVVQTKRFVGSSLNMILTRQTCGQRSSRATESNRRALGNYFSEQVCYIFPLSKFRGDWDLGLCTCEVLAKRELLHNAKFWFLLRAKHVFNRKSPLRSGSLFASTSQVHRPRSQFPLYFDSRNV